jgi:hypothetical protein
MDRFYCFQVQQMHSAHFEANKVLRVLSAGSRSGAFGLRRRMSTGNLKLPTNFYQRLHGGRAALSSAELPGHALTSQKETTRATVRAHFYVNPCTNHHFFVTFVCMNAQELVTLHSCHSPTFAIRKRNCRQHGDGPDTSMARNKLKIRACTSSVIGLIGL